MSDDLKNVLNIAVSVKEIQAGDEFPAQVQGGFVSKRMAKRGFIITDKAGQKIVVLASMIPARKLRG